MNRWVLFTIFLGVLLGFGLSIKPWQVAREQRSRAREQILDMRTAESKQAQLIRERARLESPLGKEELARSKGYIPKGEELIYLNPALKGR